MFSGWLVDTENGLFLLEDHFPEDYEHPNRIKIANDDLMYQVLMTVPALGGGQSLLFYRARLKGDLGGENPPQIRVCELEVEVNRNSGIYERIKLDTDLINKMVEEFGHYKFKKISPSTDWLD
ncbi:hypothetical protein LQD23_02440 [Chromobacterium violaceum]|uniref:hypothetical protein n=1 Tax=Chromobacterium violaceum TaxID=536 RepID=UPI0012699A18|nr:hypothetical protein [Chromobacterium violaceum]MCD0491156.1 hypothetical protein [Chromobacterium violaceum]